MLRRRDVFLLLLMLFLRLPIQSSGAACPLDLDAASLMMPSACYANATRSTAITSCCWYVFAAYLFAATRHANLTGTAFLPPATAAACSMAFSNLLSSRGLVTPGLLSKPTCDLSSSNLAANGRPCEYPTVAAIRSNADLFNASYLCASPSAGNLTGDLSTAAELVCTSCQTAVIAVTFALLNATQTKEFVPCGMAATIGIWSPFYPSLPRFRAYALCMLQVLENVGGLGSMNLVPSPPPPSPPTVTSISVVPSSASSSSASKSIKIAVASASAGLLSVAVIVFLAFKIRRVVISSAASDDSFPESKPLTIPSSPLPTDGLYIFTKAELKAATNGYDDRLLLGEGGAGKVYLGRLPSGQNVAIKRIYREKKLAEFYAEVAILAKLRHPNLTTLVGYCLSDGRGRDDEREYALVYEYMAGGNLARPLFGGAIPWPRRVRIAAEVAEGLAYLHGFPGGVVVHRDVKPNNVLLTEDAGVAKLSDFGVSRVVPPDGTHLSTQMMGTMGYVDPESFAVGHVSPATDVYSFGVVLLEMVTGRRAVVSTPTGGAESIVHAARAVVDAGEEGLASVVDRRLGERWDRGTVRAVFELACRCVRPVMRERPRMAEAVALLRAALAELEAQTVTTEEISASESSPTWPSMSGASSSTSSCQSNGYRPELSKDGR